MEKRCFLILCNRKSQTYHGGLQLINDIYNTILHRFIPLSFYKQQQQNRLNYVFHISTLK